MIARFSKCDFWIPGQILNFKNVVSKKNFFFRNRKKSWKSSKSWKSGKFLEFEGFSMGFLSKLLRKPIENHWNSENSPLFQHFELFQDFFRFRKKKFFFRNKIFKLQNLSRNPKITLRKSCEHFKIIKKIQHFRAYHQVGVLDWKIR